MDKYYMIPYNIGMRKRKLTKNLILEIERLLNGGCTKRYISNHLGGYDSWLKSLLKAHKYTIQTTYKLVPNLAQKNKKKAEDTKKCL